MNTQTAHTDPNAAGTASAHSSAHQFAGLGDWFEVFSAGEQTDSQGRAKTWTTAELDSVIANHSADSAAPLVVGHPKTDDPAYGWTTALKREGDLLLAKAGDVAPEFESAVKARHFPKRSISLEPDGTGGYRLRHIGFLGAVAPAVPGLKDIEFNQSEAAEVFEFAMPDAVREAAWGLGSVGRVLRKVREYLISKEGIEAADEMIPGYQVDSIQEASTAIHNQLENEPERSAASAFNQSRSSQQDDDMDEKQLQAEKSRADAAEAQLAQFQQQQKLTDASALVSQLVNEGKLLPAQTAGLAEFVASLSTDTETAFEFSSGEGTSKAALRKTPHQFMADLLGSLGKQIQLGEDKREGPDAGNMAQNFNAPAGYSVSNDRAELDRKAQEYAAAHNCDYITAVTQVEALNG